MPRLGLRKLVGKRLIVIETNELHPLHRALGKKNGTWNGKRETGRRTEGRLT
jgi:hypothetical protein